MMKRMLVFAAAAAAACLNMTSCTKKAVEEKDVTLVMAEVNPPETIAGQMDQAFKEKVEELSGGKIKIDLQCSGILGDIDTLMSMVSKGGNTVQIIRLSPQSFASYDCGKTLILSVPYAFSSKEHFWNFVSSPLGEKVLNEPVEKKLGVKGLFLCEEGFRHFFSKNKIESTADFSGLSVRGTNDEAMQGLIAGLNAKSIPVNFADLYSAFQTGTVDVAEQPIANYLANHFYEVAPYMILDGHTLGVMEPAITLEAWNSLSENQQNILLEAGKYAQQFCRELSQSEEDKVRKQLIALGAEITPVKDVSPWQAACADVIKKATAADPKFYEDIQALAK